MRSQRGVDGSHGATGWPEARKKESKSAESAWAVLQEQSRPIFKSEQGVYSEGSVALDTAKPVTSRPQQAQSFSEALQICQFDTAQYRNIDLVIPLLNGYLKESWVKPVGLTELRWELPCCQNRAGDLLTYAKYDERLAEALIKALFREDTWDDHKIIQRKFELYGVSYNVVSGAVSLSSRAGEELAAQPDARGWYRSSYISISEVVGAHEMILGWLIHSLAEERILSKDEVDTISNLLLSSGAEKFVILLEQKNVSPKIFLGYLLDIIEDQKFRMDIGTENSCKIFALLKKLSSSASEEIARYIQSERDRISQIRL